MKSCAEDKQIISRTFKLPLAQYSLTMQMCGGSVHAPMKAFRLSWRRSRNCKNSKNENGRATCALRPETNHFELLLQFPGNIHLAPVDFLDGEHSAPVEADRRVERRVAEIGLGVRAERHL